MCFVSCHGEAKGKTLEEYVEKHQDRSRSALQKSHEAAFNAWVEELRADQTQFISDRILQLALKINCCHDDWLMIEKSIYNKLISLINYYPIYAIHCKQSILFDQPFHL